MRFKKNNSFSKKKRNGSTKVINNYSPPPYILNQKQNLDLLPKPEPEPKHEPEPNHEPEPSVKKKSFYERNKTAIKYAVGTGAVIGAGALALRHRNNLKKKAAQEEKAKKLLANAMRRRKASIEKQTKAKTLLANAMRRRKESIEASKTSKPPTLPKQLRLTGSPSSKPNSELIPYVSKNSEPKTPKFYVDPKFLQKPVPTFLKKPTTSTQKPLLLTNYSESSRSSGQLNDLKKKLKDYEQQRKNLTGQLTNLNRVTSQLVNGKQPPGPVSKNIGTVTNRQQKLTLDIKDLSRKISETRKKISSVQGTSFGRRRRTSNSKQLIRLKNSLKRLKKC